MERQFVYQGPAKGGAWGGGRPCTGGRVRGWMGCELQRCRCHLSAASHQLWVLRKPPTISERHQRLRAETGEQLKPKHIRTGKEIISFNSLDLQ